MATTNEPVGLPSASAPRTSRSLRPLSSSSLLVETTVPITRPRSMREAPLLLARGPVAGAELAPRLVGAPERQRQVDVGVRPRDHVDADQLAHALGAAG